MFDLIGLENKITRHEAELLSKKKIPRKLMEEISISAAPAARPAAAKLKASRCVRPRGSGEGRLSGSPQLTQVYAW